MRDPTNSQTIADLDSPQLHRAVCRPLRVPVEHPWLSDGTGAFMRSRRPIWGSLTFYGSFAVAIGDSGDAIERCGTNLHLHIPIVGNLGATENDPASLGNERMVLWSHARQELGGVFLPSLRRFTILLPSLIDGVDHAAMGNRTLYVLDDHLELWRTSLPNAPPPS